MSSCINCDSLIVDDEISYVISDLGDELTTIILARILVEVDTSSVICERCFDNILSNHELKKRESKPQVTVRDTNVCVCCDHSLRGGRRSVVLRNPERAIMLRIHNIEVTHNSARVCYKCWFRLHGAQKREIPATTPPPQSVIVVERCASCSELLFGKQTHILRNGPERNFIAAKIQPQEIPDNAYVCQKCWMTAWTKIKRDREIEQASVLVQETESLLQQESESLPQQESKSLPQQESDSLPQQGSDSLPHQQPESLPLLEQIDLDSVTRVKNSASSCFVPGCKNPERLSVPKYLKKQLLKTYSVYIPVNCRICQEHKVISNWEFLKEFKLTNTFTRYHIDDMISILREQSNGFIDFNNKEM